MRWEPRPDGPERPEALLRRFSAKIQQLTERARAAVREAVPAAAEQVRPNRGYFGYRLRHQFAFIEPLQGYVRVAFPNGAALEDPSGLLETEPGRSVRYARLTRPADARHPALALLLKQAALSIPAKRPLRGRAQLLRRKPGRRLPR